MNRRRFLTRLPLSLSLPAPALLAACSCSSSSTSKSSPRSSHLRPLRFGLITDVHQDIMHDGVDRLSAFVDAMTRERVDFIAQLGDFCWPHPRNRSFMETWNRFPGPRYHVLGNHDMDGGYAREQTVGFYGMPARHYAFQAGGLKFLVLDGNDPGGTSRGYKRFVAADQLAWLTTELRQSSQPVVVFIHQALDHPQGIENQAEVRAILEQARTATGSPRVVAVFSGHHHQDWTRTLAGIHYLQINSASYFWLGEKFAHDSYPPAVLDTHPTIRMTCPYREPLWALVTLDPQRGSLRLEGRTSSWVGPAPRELGVAPEPSSPDPTCPEIRPRRLSWPSA